jgi:uncharacterized membrane protein
VAGARYRPAQALIQSYCAPCHTRAGTHPLQRTARAELTLDTYGELRARSYLIEKAVTVHGVRADMPPVEAPRQPAAGERALLIDWLQRGAPNTPDGR